jgi:hypothetical protein
LECLDFSCVVFVILTLSGEIIWNVIIHQPCSPACNCPQLPVPSWLPPSHLDFVLQDTSNSSVSYTINPSKPIDSLCDTSSTSEYSCPSLSHLPFRSTTGCQTIIIVIFILNDLVCYILVFTNIEDLNFLALLLPTLLVTSLKHSSSKPLHSTQTLVFEKRWCTTSCKYNPPPLLIYFVKPLRYHYIMRNSGTCQLLQEPLCPPWKL